MAKVLVVKHYYVWYSAEVEVEEDEDGEVTSDAVYDAIEEQDPVFTEYERDFRDTTWEVI